MYKRFFVIIVISFWIISFSYIDVSNEATLIDNLAVGSVKIYTLLKNYVFDDLEPLKEKGFPFIKFEGGLYETENNYVVNISFRIYGDYVKKPYEFLPAYTQAEVYWGRWITFLNVASVFRRDDIFIVTPSTDIWDNLIIDEKSVQMSISKEKESKSNIVKVKIFFRFKFLKFESPIYMEFELITYSEKFLRKLSNKK